MIENEIEKYKFFYQVVEEASSTNNLIKKIKIFLKRLGEFTGIKKSVIYPWSPISKCFINGVGSDYLPLKSRRIIFQNIISVSAKETIYHKIQEGQTIILNGEKVSSYLPNTKSILVIPLIYKRSLLGVFVMEGDKVIGIDKKEFFELINIFVKQFAISIENTQLQKRLFRENNRYKQELNMAYDIQHSLLPRSIPTLKGMDISAKYKSGKIIGGDFYLYQRFRFGTPKLGIVIGDVSGKGVPAALIMAMAMTVVKQCLRSFTEPKIAFANMNNIIASHLERYSPCYVTVFYGILDLESNNFTYCKAGHPPPLWYHKKERNISHLDADGMMFGMFEKLKYEQKTVKVRSGDKIIFYTDGITDARNEGEDLFGIKRLEEIITKREDAKPLQLNNSIFHSLSRFIDRKTQVDDMTLITIGIL